MVERRLSYHELEDGIATLVLFEDPEIQEEFLWN